MGRLPLELAPARPVGEMGMLEVWRRGCDWESGVRIWMLEVEFWRGVCVSESEGEERVRSSFELDMIFLGFDW